MPNLAPTDLMIVLIYFFFTVSIGVGLKAFVSSSESFLLAGRKMPAWLAGLAMAGASLGAVEVLAMGAAGARFGPVSAGFFGVGAVVPLLFAALYLVPAYAASKARSLPEYLAIRFDAKTRLAGAVASLAGSLVMAALALYAMARVGAALRLIDAMFRYPNIKMEWQLLLAVVVPAAFALLVVLLGGLGATLYAQVVQFSVLVFGFLPMVLLGLKQVGGWDGMHAAFSAAIVGQDPVPVGLSALAAAALLGVVLTAGAACADMSLMQAALAAESPRMARRSALIAAGARAVLPLLLVVPGVLAVSLPTPHTAITIHNENGAIVHDIQVVPQAQDQGLGLVPVATDQVADPMSGNLLKDAKGRLLFDYTLATPFLLPHNLPTGLLGLGLAGLLACLVSSVMGRISGFNTVFVLDVYQARLRKDASEKHLVLVARLTALVAAIAASALAWGGLHLKGIPDLLDLLAVALAVVFAPVAATFVLGALWKRTSAAGAFAGMAAGFVAALLHWGLTVPAGYTRGLAGGWIAPLHHPHSMLAQNAGTAICAMLANVLLAVAVSLCSEAKTESESMELVAAAKPARVIAWWKRPAGVAALILVAATVVALVFV